MTERWKPVAGYEGVYEVSDLGRIRSVDRLIAYKGTAHQALRRGRPLKGVPDKKGYIHLVLCKEGKQRTCFLSRLVAQAFVPNPDNLPDVHHINFNQSDNSAQNLVWVTHQQNVRMSVSSGRYAKKLTEAIVREIRARAEAGESQSAIGRSLGVRFAAVHLIVNGLAWRHVK